MITDKNIADSIRHSLLASLGSVSMAPMGDSAKTVKLAVKLAVVPKDLELSLSQFTVRYLCVAAEVICHRIRSSVDGHCWSFGLLPDPDIAGVQSFSNEIDGVKFPVLVIRGDYPLKPGQKLIRIEVVFSVDDESEVQQWVKDTIVGEMVEVSR